jgi:MFS family permease
VTLQGIVKDYHSLLTTRIFLGLFEAGFFPAASFLLTTWYCRFELQSRLSVFYSSAAFASGFSGLLAFAISNMAGVAGLGGWRWIFIIEGMATVVIGGLIALFLPDSIEDVKFLTEDEKKFLAYRLRYDSGVDGAEVGSKEPFQWRYLWAALGDWHIWLAAIIYWGNRYNGFPSKARFLDGSL